MTKIKRRSVEKILMPLPLLPKRTTGKPWYMCYTPGCEREWTMNFHCKEHLFHIKIR